jgi:Methyltransferase domain
VKRSCLQSDPCDIQQMSLLTVSDMTKIIPEPKAAMPVSQAMDIVTPFAAKSLFWRLQFLELTPFLHHVPFLFWLMETLRPACVVQFGLREGVSYFAACQAADKLGLDARCYGLSGYDAEGGQAVSQRMLTHNGEQFSDMSRVSDADPALTLRRIPQGAVNLMVVDGDLSEFGLAALESDWLSVLADDGILLLHGLDTQFASGAARVFAERLIEMYPTITLDAGDGLLVVLCGNQPGDRLQQLADLQLGSHGYGEIHRVFSRLGEAMHFEAQSRVASGRTAALRSELDQALAQIAQLEQLEHPPAPEEEPAVDAASLEAALATQRGEMTAVLTANLAAQKADLDAKADTVRLELVQRCEDYYDELATAQQTLKEARQGEKTRFGELALLTGLVEQLRAENAEILNSSSWKVTGPIRRAMRLVRK